MAIAIEDKMKIKEGETCLIKIDVLLFVALKRARLMQAHCIMKQREGHSCSACLFVAFVIVALIPG